MDNDNDNSRQDSVIVKHPKLLLAILLIADICMFTLFAEGKSFRSYWFVFIVFIGSTSFSVIHAITKKYDGLGLLFILVEFFLLTLYCCLLLINRFSPTVNGVVQVNLLAVLLSIVAVLFIPIYLTSLFFDHKANTVKKVPPPGGDSEISISESPKAAFSITAPCDEECQAPPPDESVEMDLVDKMDGHQFEHWCVELLRRNGFHNLSLTPETGDQGVDITAEKDDIRYAIQCKCYSSDLGNTPVQEVNTGKTIYHCHIGVVMTNRYFTSGGKQAADATGVLLWDRDKLFDLLKKSSRK